MAFLIPGYSTVAAFCKQVGLPYMTVVNQMKAGYCKWPYKKHTRDGRVHHPLYKTWDSMIGRCYHKSNASYKRYGGRGITVCQAWKDDFNTFIQDMGDKPGPNYSLDRIDNSKGYSKSNCQWLLRSQQVRKQARSKTSRYYGVSLHQTGKWRAELSGHGGDKYLGLYATEMEAAVVVRKAEIQQKLNKGAW